MNVERILLESGPLDQNYAVGAIYYLTIGLRLRLGSLGPMSPLSRP